jgi:hypothetical protein
VAVQGSARKEIDDIHKEERIVDKPSALAVSF